MSGFDEWVAEAGDVAGETRKLRDAVWHNHLHTGETVRTIRKADRTAGKVSRLKTDGNGHRGSMQRSTVGAYTQRIRRSAESQYFGRLEAGERRAAAEAMAHGW